MIYLDNAATTRIDDEVLEAMLPFLKDKFGNPGTIYPLGEEAKRAVDKAREQTADFFGCSPKHVVFTSGGSASNNLVFKGLRPHLSLTKKNSVSISNIEHDSVRRAAYSLFRNDGFSVSNIPCDENGMVELESVTDTISDKTGLVSVMFANNETGVVNPVKEIGSELKERGVLFHTDCVQAAGCYNLNVNDMPCDFASISSHKIHGPKGMGALFIRNPDIMSPLINGGLEQEYGLWAGTENVAGIVGFGKACEMAGKTIEDTYNYVSDLRARFYNVFTGRMEKWGLGDRFSINGGATGGKALNLRIEGIHGSSLVLAAALRGLCISAGSACSGHESVPSHVLMALGIGEDAARQSVRISFSRMNSIEEVTQAAVTLADTINQWTKKFEHRQI